MLFKQACIKKKHQKKRDKKEKTLASTLNITEVKKIQKKNRNCDVSNVTCYHCNKIGDYANICIKPKS